MTIDAEPGARRAPRPSTADASVGQLASQLSEQVTRLVRDELALAQIEAKQSAKKIGLGVGMFGAGGIFGFFAVGVLVAAAVLGLATAMSGWLAALIVAAALLVIAGIVALTGKKSLAAGTPPVPTQAIESTKADVAAVREAVKR
jgi:MFS family permease